MASHWASRASSPYTARLTRCRPIKLKPAENRKLFELGDAIGEPLLCLARAKQLIETYPALIKGLRDPDLNGFGRAGNFGIVRPPFASRTWLTCAGHGDDREVSSVHQLICWPRSVALHVAAQPGSPRE